MRTLVLLSVVAAVLVVAQHPVMICFPPVFTTEQISIVQAQDDISHGKLWYSYDLKKERLDLDHIIHGGKTVKARFSFVLDYPKKVWYEIKYLPGTANCTKHTLSHDMEPLCLSKNAELRGNPILGGVLECSNWFERVSQGSFKVALDFLIATNVNVPIRRIARPENRSMEVTEWWNFVEAVHHDAFVLPDACNSATVDMKAWSRSDVMSLAPRHNVL